MRTQLILMMAFFAILSLGHSQTNTECTILFESNSSILTPQSKLQLEEWVNGIGLKNIQSMTISGHTDSDGTDHYNQWLSKRRIESVETFLNNKKILCQNMSKAPEGESMPIANNDSDIGKQSNRRVNIQAVLSKPNFAITSERLAPPVQAFIAQANNDISIQGAGGTEITIPAYSLVSADGKTLVGEVKIELTEYLEKSDFLFGGLHTQSGYRLLETGGTILIEAFGNGQKLQLAEGQKIDILFARREEGDGMEIFNGKHTEDGVLDWSRASANSVVFEAVTIEGGFIQFTRSKNGIVESRSILDGPMANWKLDSLTMGEYEEQAEMTNLMMSSSKLGWINCDRFSPVEQNTELIVNVDTAYHPSVFLVFDDINSVMRGYYWDKEIKFQRIPSNRKVKVIALSYVNEQAYYAMQQLTTDEVSEVEMAMVPVGENELKRLLKRMN